MYLRKTENNRNNNYIKINILFDQENVKIILFSVFACVLYFYAYISSTSCQQPASPKWIVCFQNVFFNNIVLAVFAILKQKWSLIYGSSLYIRCLLAWSQTIKITGAGDATRVDGTWSCGWRKCCSGCVVRS